MKGFGTFIKKKLLNNIFGNPTNAFSNTKKLYIKYFKFCLKYALMVPKLIFQVEFDII